MTVSLVKAYPHPHAKIAMSQGNMEVLPNGNVFVGWGSTGYASEFTVDGTVLLDADFTGSIQSYRCFRYPVDGPADGHAGDRGRPAGNGSVTSTPAGTGRPRLRAGRSSAGPAPRADLAGHLPATDFETILAVKPTARYLAVNALDANGAVLGTSTAMTVPD